MPQSRSLATSTTVAALVALLALAAACAPNPPIPTATIAVNSLLLVNVVDSTNDVGRVPALSLDKDANPTVAYLLLKDVLKEGQLPVPIQAGQPQPPAVMLAVRSNGVWTRASTTPQSRQPAKGLAPGVSNDQGEFVRGVTLAMAMDAQGHHHIAWSSPAGLFYTTDAAGAFGDPVKILSTPTLGASIAVAQDGRPFIAYYQGDGVRVATKVGDQWAEALVANVTAGALLPTRTAIAIGSDGHPMVAYTDPGARTPMLARSFVAVSAPLPGPAVTPGAPNLSWVPTPIEPGGGGWAISLSLDREGNPHVAYYSDQSGSAEVHHAHQIAGATWTVDAISRFRLASGQDVSAWSTGIVTDPTGTHFVTWTDTQANRVMLASSSAGAAWLARAIRDSVSGQNPSLAMSADGKSLAVAWYDSANSNLNVATLTSAGASLAYSPPPPASAPSVSPTSSGPPCSPSGSTDIKITAPSGASGSGFDVNCLAAPAGKAFTITFTNDDTQPHNMEIFTADPLTDPSAQRIGGATGPGDFITGPGATATYKNDPVSKGTYFFHCDIHPTTMTGTFVVA